MEYVVVVDSAGRPVRSEEKIRAHRDGGVLHLAFSVLLFNHAGELLLQRRADSKYHFAGLWSNTCCGHPRPGEAVAEAAERRLGEELGLAVRLRPVTHFVYHAEDPCSGLAEQEYTQVLVGRVPGRQQPAPDPEEVGAWRWLEPAAVRSGVAQEPETYTPWFCRLIREHPVADWLAA